MEDLLFYEDNKKGKRNLLIFISILSLCFIGLATAYILSFVIVAPGYVPNNFKDNLLSNFIFIFVLLLIIASIIVLILYLTKSRRLKYTLSITKTDICFTNINCDKTEFKIKEFIAYEIVDKMVNYARIRLMFKDDIVININTRKFYELTELLDRFRPRKKN